MNEEMEKKSEPEWKGDYDWLSRRVDRLENTTYERDEANKKRIVLLLRILVDKKIIGEEIAKSIEESFAKNNEEETNGLIDWLLEETVGIEEAKKLWISGAIKKKGALRKQLGIKEDEVIPKSILQKIVNTETGKTVSFRGKTIKVTTQLKRRALLALRLGKMSKT